MSGKTPKRKRSFSITDEADLLLEALAKKYGIAKTAMLEIMIREKAEQEGVTVDHLH